MNIEDMEDSRGNAPVIGQLRLLCDEKIIVTDLVELYAGEIWVEFLWSNGVRGNSPYGVFMRASNPL